MMPGEGSETARCSILMILVNCGLWGGCWLGILDLVVEREDLNLLSDCRAADIACG